MAIVSNFDDTLPRLLDQLGVTCYFETIVVSDLVGVVKPDPEILHIACDRMNIFPSQTLYIGDHPMDVLCARLAGMPVAWLREAGDRIPEYLGCHADIELEDIQALLWYIKVGEQTQRERKPIENREE